MKGNKDDQKHLTELYWKALFANHPEIDGESLGQKLAYESSPIHADKSEKSRLSKYKPEIDLRTNNQSASYFEINHKVKGYKKRGGTANKIDVNLYGKEEFYKNMNEETSTISESNRISGEYRDMRSINATQKFIAKSSKLIDIDSFKNIFARLNEVENNDPQVMHFNSDFNKSHEFSLKTNDYDKTVNYENQAIDCKIKTNIINDGNYKEIHTKHKNKNTNYDEMPSNEIKLLEKKNKSGSQVIYNSNLLFCINNNPVEILTDLKSLNSNDLSVCSKINQNVCAESRNLENKYIYNCNNLSQTNYLLTNSHSDHFKSKLCKTKYNLNDSSYNWSTPTNHRLLYTSKHPTCNESNALNQTCHLFPNKINQSTTNYNSTHLYDLDVEMNYVNSPYTISIENIYNNLDLRTTCMLKNIPNKYTQKMLIELLNESHFATFDFLYLRMDFSNECNVGYAFVNFIDPLVVASFYKKVNGKGWLKYSSSKIAELTYASIQGMHNLVHKFRNSRVMDEHKSFRPKLFYTQGPFKGLEKPNFDI